ncbi:MAG TPA: SRPBCC family protein [Actinomycetota bacterium]
MRLRAHARIDAPPEAVWAVVADWEAQREWMPDVAWIRVDGAERGLGARLLVRTKVLGVAATTDVIDVLVWEPPHRIGIVHRGLVRGRAAWLLDPAEDGRSTNFTWLEELRLPPPILGEIPLVLYAPVQALLQRRSVANLKRRVESAR